MKSLIALFLASFAMAAWGASCDLSKPKQAIFTNYWVAIEGTKDQDENGKEIVLDGPNTVALKTCDGKTIAMTNEKMAKKCSLEGTCRLKDGRTLNVGSNMHCFEVLPKNQPWGVGGNDNPLVPMVSVASNGLKFGTKVKISELVNKKLPNGKTHNGCVRVDDTCSSCKNSCHLDFMVGTYDNYKKLDTPDKVTAVVDSSCQILNYGK